MGVDTMKILKIKVCMQVFTVKGLIGSALRSQAP